ncbi:MAG: radical SAM protein [Verrucomicrobiota bacterium]|nr:radical SAM protein [Verrucomicrobiota bacterium]MDD8046164.1 radical SAM protein [Verrucomicrobiota bacterium]MDD8051764.1 radical SAM protein [Verrucomicrobiota bacterium]
MNIGMFPMSGIRVCDTELLQLGLTLPGFVERSKTIASLPSLGLLTLAGMTPAEHRLEYVEVPDLQQLDALPTELDLAAISTYSAQIDEAYELADWFRTKGVPTVIGGPHVTAVPEEAAQHCDAVVVGEGECAWPQVLEDVERGRLQRYYRSDRDGFDLADAPMPAFELLDISKYNRLTVQTSRGCPHQCEFCASSVVLTQKYKQKPAEKVIAEIERILTIWAHPFLEFADDNSFVNHAYWRELLGRLKGKGLRWFAETDLSVAEDDALLELMRESGCAQVLIGLESPVEAGLTGLELRNDWKHRKLPDYRDAIRTIQGHGITVNGCFVIGLDGHTTDIFDQVLDFVRETELYEVQITVLTPFPGTPLYARLEAEDRLLEPSNWKTCTLFDINFKPALMTVDELHEGFKRLAVEMYGDEFTHWRRERFRQAMRARLQAKEGRA